MPFPAVGEPLPRASDASAPAEKWTGWILVARGHGPQWSRVFGIGPDDGDQVWGAIARAAPEARVSSVRDREPHGVVCGAEMVLTLNGRTARVATAWHYRTTNDPPTLVTAYPTP